MTNVSGWALGFIWLLFTANMLSLPPLVGGFLSVTLNFIVQGICKNKQTHYKSEKTRLCWNEHAYLFTAKNIIVGNVQEKS